MQSGSLLLPNNETIYYEEWMPQEIGKAPSILFLHGNISNCEWWYDTVDTLKHLKRHLIAIDQRGFGKSSYNNKCQRFGDWAEDAKLFCKARGIEKCVVNGWSFGGAIAMKLAELAPELVQKVILTCSVSHEGFFYQTDGKPCRTISQIVQHSRVKMMHGLITSNNFQKMKEVLEGVLFTHTGNMSSAKKDNLVRASFQQKCFLELQISLANSDIDINKIKAQILMVHGKQDLRVPLEKVKITGEKVKNFVVWENNAHLIPVESPKEYAELITKFIEEQ